MKRSNPTVVRTLVAPKTVKSDKTILSASCLQQGTPHPPPKGGPRSTMGNYRTTMFRRDFNRLQAQRNQGFPKEPVSIKQGTMPLEKEIIPNTPETSEVESQASKDTNGAVPVEQGAATSDVLANLNLEQMSAFSDDGRSIGQVYCCVYVVVQYYPSL